MSQPSHTSQGQQWPLYTSAASMPLHCHPRGGLHPSPRPLGLDLENSASSPIWKDNAFIIGGGGSENATLIILPVFYTTLQWGLGQLLATKHISVSTVRPGTFHMVNKTCGEPQVSFAPACFATNWLKSQFGSLNCLDFRIIDKEWWTLEVSLFHSWGSRLGTIKYPFQGHPAVPSSRWSQRSMGPIIQGFTGHRKQGACGLCWVQLEPLKAWKLGVTWCDFHSRRWENNPFILVGDDMLGCVCMRDAVNSTPCARTGLCPGTAGTWSWTTLYCGCPVHLGCLLVGFSLHIRCQGQSPSSQL